MANSLTEKVVAFFEDHWKTTLLGNTRLTLDHSTVVCSVSNRLLTIWSHQRINLKARGILIPFSSSAKIHQKASVMLY